jgi:hypothetical protein
LIGLALSIPAFINQLSLKYLINKYKIRQSRYISDHNPDTAKQMIQKQEGQYQFTYPIE